MSKHQQKSAGLEWRKILILISGIWDFLILIFLYWVNYRSDGSIYSNPWPGLGQTEDISLDSSGVRANLYSLYEVHNNAERLYEEQNVELKPERSKTVHH